MSDERKKMPPPDYSGAQSDYSGGPIVSSTATQDSITIHMTIEMKLDPEKLRCLQDSGITCTSNVVT